MHPELGGPQPPDVEQPADQQPLHDTIMPAPDAGQPGQEQPLTWVQPNEAAEKAGVSLKTIYNWIHDGHVQVERRPVVIYRMYVPLEQVLTYKDVPKEKGGRPSKTP